MILVILSAFQGRLRSEPIEWPREEPEIRLPMSPSDSGGFVIGKYYRPQMALRIAIFKRLAGRAEILPDGRLAYVYELVDV